MGDGFEVARYCARLHDCALGGLPYELQGKVSSRIINEVRGINRVMYDISGKQLASTEQEYLP